MASTDKYCQEFMHFLDDEPVSQLEGEMSPLTELITQIGSENQIQLERGMPPPRQ